MSELVFDYVRHILQTAKMVIIPRYSVGISFMISERKMPELSKYKAIYCI